MRHRDHRFEWTRAEFPAWATRVAARHGYGVRIRAGRRRRPRGRPAHPAGRLHPSASVPDDDVRIPAPSASWCWSGSPGSGKSTFARTPLRPTEVISSDFCRGLVADDENDQAATQDAFDVLALHRSASGWRAGRLTVVDATNVQPRRAPDAARAGQGARRAPGGDRARPARRGWASSATHAAADRNFGPAWSSGSTTSCAVAARPGPGGLPRGARAQRRRGDRRGATIVRDRLLNDRRDEPGPFDVIGDVHGCRAELETLLDELGYASAATTRAGRSTPHHPTAGG